MTILGSLLNDGLAGRALNQLLGRGGEAGDGPQGPGPGGPDMRHGNGPGGDNGLHLGQGQGQGQANGAGGTPTMHTGGNAPATGGPPAGPSTHAGNPWAGGPMHTGGNAPQGMQAVAPGIASQISQSLLSVANSTAAVVREALAPPAPAPAPPAQAAAEAAAQAQGAAHAASRGAVPVTAQAGPAATVGNPNPSAAANGASPPVATAVANPGAPATSTAAPGPLAGATATATPAAPAPAAAPTGNLTGQAPIADASAATQARNGEAVVAPRADGALNPGRTATVAPGNVAANAVGLQNAALPPGATQAAVAAGLTVAVAPTTQPADARGVVLPVGEQAAQRAESALTLAGHTIDGLLRRPMRQRVRALPQGLTRLLWSIGVMGTGRDGQPDPERDMQRAMQWLFWMMAVIAYGCLGAAIVAFVGGDARPFEQPGRSYTGWLAIFGVATGSAAWWLARRMARRR